MLATSATSVAGAADIIATAGLVVSINLVMGPPDNFAIRLTTLVFICSIGGLMSCRSQQAIHVLSYAQGRALSRDYQTHYKPRQQTAKWLGPPATYVRYRRINPTSAPIIAGCVDSQEENNKFTPLPGAVIAIGGAYTFTDNAGNYVRVVGPGLHYIRVGGVGFLWSEEPALRVKNGDSVRISFHLLPEFRPTMN